MTDLRALAHAVIYRHNREAMSAKNDFFEDAIAGLLANGVSPSELHILEYPNNRTVLAVRGIERYEFSIKQTYYPVSREMG